MMWAGNRRAGRAPVHLNWWVMAGCGLALAGCTTDGSPSTNVAIPRGATIAFESIDGAPPAIFQKLVSDLNDEAQTRRLAVLSRDGNAAFRVRGYLAARTIQTKSRKTVKTGKTTIGWVWDIYDAEQNRVLRLSGEEAVAHGKADAWSVADDAMVRRIARASMEQLGAFLTAPDGRQAGAEVAAESVHGEPVLTLAATQTRAVANR